MQKLQVFTTGDSIDKIYFDALSEFQIGPPGIDTILKQMNIGFDYQAEALMRLDSLDMTDDHRRQIQQRAAGSEAQYILINHGTDGMVKTASWLNKLGNKTIVLTGALQPAALANTDAVFNIGCAIGAMESLGSGVYIAMDGQVFTADKVVTNSAEHRFEKNALMDLRTAIRGALPASHP